MSANGSHLGCRSGPPHTVLKVDYQRTIHAMFALNWPTSFRNYNHFPLGSFVKTMQAYGSHLGCMLGS